MTDILLALVIIAYIMIVSIATYLIIDRKHKEEIPKPKDTPKKDITITDIYNYLDEKASPGKVEWNKNKTGFSLQHFDTVLHDWIPICEVDEYWNVRFDKEIDAIDINAPTIEECVGNLFSVIKFHYGETAGVYARIISMVNTAASIDGINCKVTTADGREW